MDSTSTPVFYKGNIKAMFKAHDLGTPALNRWREDFPIHYHNGAVIPAVARRQQLCREHGWTPAIGAVSIELPVLNGKLF